GLGQVGAVELGGEFHQHLVAFDEDPLEDLAHRFGRGGIDLELGGVEPPAPLTQVEEREHQDSSGTPGCSCDSDAGIAGRLRDHTIHPQMPTAHAATAKVTRESRKVASRSMEGRQRTETPWTATQRRGWFPPRERWCSRARPPVPGSVPSSAMSSSPD